MKVIGWNEYSGVFEGKPYLGYYLYLSMPHPAGTKNCCGERVRIEKVRKSSAAFGQIPMLQAGDEIQQVYYDRRGNVEELKL